VLLIGLRGSGKTSAGAIAARRLGLPFLDLDDATRALLNAPTVAHAWHAHGEPAFRAAEVRALGEALRMPPRVIALGGGTPTAPGAADLIRAADALVIYLRADAEALRQRLRDSIASDPDRPSLTGADPLAEIDQVLARRDPLYVSLASHVVDVRALSVEDTACRIITLARSASPP
jgi:3-dehydroquinate synthase